MLLKTNIGISFLLSKFNIVSNLKRIIPIPVLGVFQTRWSLWTREVDFREIGTLKTRTPHGTYCNYFYPPLSQHFLPRDLQPSTWKKWTYSRSRAGKKWLWLPRRIDASRRWCRHYVSTQEIKLRPIPRRINASRRWCRHYVSTQDIKIRPNQFRLTTKIFKSTIFELFKF